MGDRLLESYAWVLVLQDTYQDDEPFIIHVSHRANPRDPYFDIAKGIRIAGVEDLRRFLTILGINGRTELQDSWTATFVTTEYSVDAFMSMLSQRHDHLNGSISLAVVGISLEETRERLYEWARETGGRWLDLVEVNRMEQVIIIYCYILSERFSTTGIPIDEILRIQSDIRESSYSREEIIQAAVQKLERENTIRATEENGVLVLQPGFRWR
jgi:hypothetical protein